MQYASDEQVVFIKEHISVVYESMYPKTHSQTSHH